MGDSVPWERAMVENSSEKSFHSVLDWRHVILICRRNFHSWVLYWVAPVFESVSDLESNKSESLTAVKEFALPSSSGIPIVH